MALTLVATAGSPSANSYCTVAEADSYHEGHLYATAWTGAVTATKEAALVMATRLLDQWYAWAENPTSTTQALQWPRNGVMDFLYLSTLSDSEIPPQLKNATAELARQLIASDRTANNTVTDQGLTSMSAGPVSFSFKDQIKVSVMPDAVKPMIPAWWGRLRGAGVWQPIGRS